MKSPVVRTHVHLLQKLAARSRRFDKKPSRRTTKQQVHKEQE